MGEERDPAGCGRSPEPPAAEREKPPASPPGEPDPRTIVAETNELDPYEEPGPGGKPPPEDGT